MDPRSMSDIQLIGYINSYIDGTNDDKEFIRQVSKEYNYRRFSKPEDLVNE